MKKATDQKKPTALAVKEASSINRPSVTAEALTDCLFKAEKHLKKSYPSHYDVLKARFFVSDEARLKYASTYEVSATQGVTKQRTHQKQEKAVGIMAGEFFSAYSPRTVYDFICQGEEREYITYDNISARLESHHAAKLLTFLMIFALPEGEIKSNYKIYAIYDSKKTSEKELVAKGLSKISKFLLPDEHAAMDQFEKALVNLNYRPIGKGFIRRCTNKFELIEEYICRNFKDGYRVSSDEDHQKLQKLVENDYGPINFPSRHNLNASYPRMTRLMLCGRGVRKPKPEIRSLDAGLLLRIEEYLKQNAPLVFYQTIYGRFEKELSALGIDSWYTLKGALDDRLPPTFKTTRNGIRIDRPDVKINVEIVKEWIAGMKGVFNASDIRNGIEAFLHVKDFVIYNYLRGIIDDCRILQLSGERFIRIDECKIPEKAEKKLRTLLDAALAQSEFGFLSGEVLLAAVKKDPEIAKAFAIIDDGWSLVRYARLAFGDRYSYTPYCIGKKGLDLPRNSKERISQYAAENSTVDYKDLARLCQEVGYKTFTVPFMEDILGPNYIRVSETLFVRADKFPKSAVQELEETLAAHFKKTNTNVLTQSDLTVEFVFNLPRLRYPWTIYLFTSFCKRLSKERFKLVLNSKAHLQQLIYSK